MTFWSTLSIATREIVRNRARSALTALGILIGVAAVIIMVHLGQSATRSVTDQVASLGRNLLVVTPGTHRGGPGGTRAAAPPFDVADGTAISREVSGILVAPSVSDMATVVYGNVNWTTTVIGTTSDFFPIGNWEVADGRLFEPAELASGARVCVLGATVAKELFGAQEPLGASLRVGKTSCAVVGVLVGKGQSGMGQDQDDRVIMPLRTVQRRLAGTQDVSLIYIAALQDGDTVRVQSEIESLLRERRRIGPGVADDFTVRDMKEIATALQGVTATLTALLAGIAAVSLLVGGIGIMNIMLVSVTERTREIGIRLAIGARSGEVMMQFLVEAGLLSALGGLAGIALGLAVSKVLASKLGMTFVLVPEVAIFAFLFSAAVGVVFGFVPARRAARMNPIEALRHE